MPHVSCPSHAQRSKFKFMQTLQEILVNSRHRRWWLPLAGYNLQLHDCRYRTAGLRRMWAPRAPPPPAQSRIGICGSWGSGVSNNSRGETGFGRGSAKQKADPALRLRPIATDRKFVECALKCFWIATDRPVACLDTLCSGPSDYPNQFAFRVNPFKKFDGFWPENIVFRFIWFKWNPIFKVNQLRDLQIILVGLKCGWNVGSPAKNSFT